jgi:hypothetical protein
MGGLNAYTSSIICKPLCLSVLVAFLFFKVFGVDSIFKNNFRKHEKNNFDCNLVDCV